MSRKPSNYWEKRATDLMLELEKDTNYTIKDILNIYNQATKNINKEIANIYKNFAKDGVLSKETLQKLLNTKETEQHYKNLLYVIDNYVTDETTKKRLLVKYNAPAYSYRISRLQALQDNIDVEMNKIATLESNVTKSRYVDTVEKSYYKSIYNIQKGIGYGFSFSNLDTRLLKVMLNNKWIDNKNYSERIWKNTEKLGDYLKANLTAGMITGKSVQKMSKDLSEYMNMGMFNATTLVRTEVNHFANEATALAYKECNIDKYQFSATLDIKTCDRCARLDNKVFELKDRKTGVNHPPMHPNDRCTTTPFIGEDEMAGLKRRARDPKTGKTYLVDANTNYEEWKKSIDNKYGNGTFDVYKKMNNNFVYDQKQYLNYKNVIGKENLPTTFEKYQDMKYNNSSEYNLMKSYYRQYIENGLPDDITYKIYKDNLNNNNWQAVGFNPNYIASHKKHLKEFNNISFEEYQEKAKELLNNKSEKILTVISEEGTRFRYDIENNEFACARPNGITQTYFKPKDEIEYWKREVVNKYAKK